METRDPTLQSRAAEIHAVPRKLKSGVLPSGQIRVCTGFGHRLVRKSESDQIYALGHHVSVRSARSYKLNLPCDN